MVRGNKKSRRSGISYKVGLRLGGSAHGANTGASAAGHAGVGVDLIRGVALRDGGNRTFLGTSTALDALVADLISHDSYLLFLLLTVLYTQSVQNAISNSGKFKNQL